MSIDGGYMLAICSTYTVNVSCFIIDVHCWAEVSIQYIGVKHSNLFQAAKLFHLLKVLAGAEEKSGKVNAPKLALHVLKRLLTQLVLKLRPLPVHKYRDIYTRVYIPYVQFNAKKTKNRKPLVLPQFLKATTLCCIKQYCRLALYKLQVPYKSLQSRGRGNSKDFCTEINSRQHFPPLPASCPVLPL
jgi:hypothetical protein